MHKSSHSRAVKSGCLVALLLSSYAFAGADPTFDEITNKLTDWSTGSLGKTMALATFVVGIGAGIVRQSLMAAAVGVGSSIILNYGPKVIDTTFTAVI